MTVRITGIKMAASSIENAMGDITNGV